jgi:GTP-dependent phosphoenolpyruvate carboxykinase
VSVDHPQSGKKENKNDLKGKKKGDSKQDTDAAIVNEEVKQYVYQWKSITADGQVFVQNSTNQEYEKIDQLRLILETNPKTNEVF